LAATANGTTSIQDARHSCVRQTAEFLGLAADKRGKYVAHKANGERVRPANQPRAPRSRLRLLSKRVFGRKRQLDFLIQKSIFLVPVAAAHDGKSCVRRFRAGPKVVAFWAPAMQLADEMRSVWNREFNTSNSIPRHPYLATKSSEQPGPLSRQEGLNSGAHTNSAGCAFVAAAE